MIFMPSAVFLCPDLAQPFPGYAHEFRDIFCGYFLNDLWVFSKQELVELFGCGGDQVDPQVIFEDQRFIEFMQVVVPDLGIGCDLVLKRLFIEAADDRFLEGK